MPQVKTGIVVSNKMQKTVVVKVEVRKRHPLYKKIINKSIRLKARDELSVQIGQIVKIQEVKPISKKVHFKIVEVIK